jgi:hypothetical protein
MFGFVFRNHCDVISNYVGTWKGRLVLPTGDLRSVFCYKLLNHTAAPSAMVYPRTNKLVNGCSHSQSLSSLSLSPFFTLGFRSDFAPTSLVLVSEPITSKLSSDGLVLVVLGPEGADSFDVWMGPGMSVLVDSLALVAVECFGAESSSSSSQLNSSSF